MSTQKSKPQMYHKRRNVVNKLLVTFYILLSFAVGLVTGFVSYTGIAPESSQKSDCDSTVVTAPHVPSVRDMERELIRYDIEVQGQKIGLSKRQQEEYLVYLEEAADKYALPMILMHTVAYVETRYNPEAVHPQITVRGKKTRALGLMGVVWEYNGEYLKKEGVAKSRLELLEPKINLLAGTAILYANIKDILKNKPNISENQFFDELIRKYYGAYDERYKTTMLTQMKDIASRQWIFRTAKTIILTYQHELSVADTTTQVPDTTVVNPNG